jgi:hypothetical protein
MLMPAKHIWYAGRKLFYTKSFSDKDFWERGGQREAQMECDAGGACIHKGGKHHLYVPGLADRLGDKTAPWYTPNYVPVHGKSGLYFRRLPRKW